MGRQPAEGRPGLPDDDLVDLAAQAGATGLTGTPRVLVDGGPLAAPTAEALKTAVAAARS